MVHKLAVLVLVAILGAPLTAGAVPVTFQIKFTVLTGSVVTLDLTGPSGPSITEVDGAGKVYFGEFAVDDQLLLTDGTNKSGTLDFFRIQMEGNIWGYNDATNNSFAGFRGPDGLGSLSPGFDVANGTITNLRGGVFGQSDVPFVDFSLFGANTFNALGKPFFIPGTSSSFVRDAMGTMEILRMPEPGTLALAGLGLLMVLTSLRSRRRS